MQDSLPVLLKILKEYEQPKIDRGFKIPEAKGLSQQNTTCDPDLDLVPERDISGSVGEM